MTLSLEATRDFSTATGDLLKDMREVTGVDALIERLSRRFITDFGTWPVDRDFGFAIESELNDHPVTLESLTERVQNEILKDDQVESVLSEVVINQSNGDVTMVSRGNSEVGPFDLSTPISALTVELLSEVNEIEGIIQP